MGDRSKLLGHLPGNRKVPGLMPGWGFLLLLFPWARNFIFIALCSHPAVKPGTHCALCYQGTAEKQL